MFEWIKKYVFKIYFFEIKKMFDNNLKTIMKIISIIVSKYNSIILILKSEIILKL